jgi:hypothetical protein
MTADTGLIESVWRLALFADLERQQLERMLPMVQEVSFGEGDWVIPAAATPTSGCT